jgi:hypothetical protein
VYALLREAAALGEGIADEPLRAVDCGAMLAVVGDVAAMPVADAGALRRHDAVVRRLHTTADAVLPVRFGTTAADERSLVDDVGMRAEALAAALDLVRGCYQTTVRVFGDAAACPDDTPDVESGTGAGTRYLTARRRAATRAQAVPEIAPLRAALGNLVRAERAHRHDTPPLLASVYHLVRSADAGVYNATFEAALPELAGIRVTRSGPWAPYAFAPEELA